MNGPPDVEFCVGRVDEEKRHMIKITQAPELHIPESPLPTATPLVLVVFAHNISSVISPTRESYS
jgi:hypothetical protein